MIKKILDLLIAVTFVYAIESIYNIVNGNDGGHKLQLNFICPINWENLKEIWFYIFPPIATILHIAQVAHYHQKKEDWMVEGNIDKKIEGKWELVQIILYIIPVGALILVVKFLPHDEYRKYIMLLWVITFLAYFLGDFLTKNKWKEPDKKYQNFSELVKVVWIFDLVMFIVGILITIICFFCCGLLQGVSIFSVIISFYTFILYGLGWKFLLSTPQNNNSNS